jgi:hypothetical protein
MKYVYCFLFLFFNCFFVSAQKKQATLKLIDSKATAETKALFANLNLLSKTHIQQNTAMAGRVMTVLPGAMLSL